MNVLHSIALAAGLAILARPAAGQMAEYEVELKYAGYMAMSASSECEALAHKTSADVLTGSVTGMETGGGDDVTYTGTLKRTTALDFCQTRGDASYCIATLTGTADMEVEIELAGEEARGGYVKAEATSETPGEVKGNCSASDMREIQRDYPSGDSGASPSGQPIEDTKATDAQGRHITFFADGRSRLRVGTYPADVEGGWTLRVIRKVR